MKCIDGILLITARKKSASSLKLKDIDKVIFIDNHICVAATGLLYDSKVLVDLCKKISLKYRSIYSEPIPIEKLVSELSAVIYRITRSGNNRPFGTGNL